MTNCSQWPLRTAAIFLLLVVLVGSCGKGGTTLDQDANPSASGRAGSGPDDGGDEEPSCGNGQIDKGEDCDGDLLDGVTCISLGFTGGQLSCDPAICAFDVSTCMRPTPSNGGAGG
jgi:hypothetical protein